jgi:peroxiredoxin
MLLGEMLRPSSRRKGKPSGRIRRHTRLQRTLLTVPTALYMLLKWSLSPWLYLCRRLGFSWSTPRAFDAVANRICTPLTEGPDTKERKDVVPALRLGDAAPWQPVKFPNGIYRTLRSFAGAPLLVVLFRGSWCSYSRLHLADLDAAAPRFAEAGVQLLAVTNRPDESWWRSHGVSIPIAADPDGSLFDAFGVGNKTWIEEAWGRTVPYESAFLFDAGSRFLAADVRRISGLKPGQTFLGSERWLEIIKAVVR